jgi:hypothetical protein
MSHDLYTEKSGREKKLYTNVGISPIIDDDVAR